jgi:hypothetical protein
MRWTMFAVLVAALALVGAGCGGGDDEGAGDTDTAVVTDTATEDTTTEDTTTEDTTTEDTETDTGGSGSLASGDCAELIGASAALSEAFGAAGTSGDLGDAGTAFDSLADRVPDEIRDDFQVLADAYSEYADAIQDIGLEAGETPSAEQIGELTQALSAIDTQGVSEASTNISTWASANCPSG